MITTDAAYAGPNAENLPLRAGMLKASRTWVSKRSCQSQSQSQQERERE